LANTERELHATVPRKRAFDAAPRQQCHPAHFRDLVFIRFAHVNDLDAEARIIQRLLPVLHGDFVGIELAGGAAASAGSGWMPQN
jgi:hypothetical protein